jgi:hypothetical protein
VTLYQGAFAILLNVHVIPSGLVITGFDVTAFVAVATNKPLP